MTNYEKLKSMNVEDFANFLDSIGFDDNPWTTWFSEKYCSKCQPVKGRFEDVDHEFSFCEINHKCRLFSQEEYDYTNPLDIVRMWLQTEEQLKQFGY